MVREAFFSKLIENGTESKNIPKEYGKEKLTSEWRAGFYGFYGFYVNGL